MAVRSGTRSGDPQKLIIEVINLATMEKPPVHLILRPDGHKLIMDKREKDLYEF